MNSFALRKMDVMLETMDSSTELATYVYFFSSPNRDADLPFLRKQRNDLCDLMEVPKPQLIAKVMF